MFPTEPEHELFEFMKSLENHEISHIIEMAWDDQTTFKNIESIYKVKEEEIKHIMKLNLKKGSYKLWRVRVNSRSRRKKECVGRDND